MTSLEPGDTWEEVSPAEGVVAEINGVGKEDGESWSVEADKVLELHKSKLSPNETWCVVDSKWCRQLQQYLGISLLTCKRVKRTGQEMPGPIDNSRLWDSGNTRALRKGLVEVNDYEILPIELWGYLVRTYGIVSPQHCFPRKVITKGLQKLCSVDIYPCFFETVNMDPSTLQPKTKAAAAEGFDMCASDDSDDSSEEVRVGNLPRSYTLQRYLNMLNGIVDDSKESVLTAIPAPGEEEKSSFRLWMRVPAEVPAAAEEGEEAPAPGSTDVVAPADAGAGADIEAGISAAAAADGEGDEAVSDSKYQWVLLAADELDTPLAVLFNTVDTGVACMAEEEEEGTEAAADEPVELPRIMIEERDAKTEEFLRKESTRDWRDFRVSDVIDARDTENKWYESTVLKVEPTRVFVHYNEWDSKWDSWLDREGDALAKKGTHSTPRIMRTGGGRLGLYGSSYMSSYGSSSKGKPTKPGLVGLSNLGNTCFMNSTLQCLSNSPLLTDFFLHDKHLLKINKDNPLGFSGKVALEYGKLVHEMWEDQYTCVAPRAFKDTIGSFAPQFKGYSQQDSSELLQFLLDGLHEDLNEVLDKPATNRVEAKDRPDAVVAKEAWEVYQKRNKSMIVNFFQGQLKSRVDCPECSRCSVTFDPYLFLSVPLPGSAEHQLSVTVVFADTTKPNHEYVLTVNKMGPLTELLTALGKASGVNPAHMVVADIWQHKVYRFLSQGSSISEIGRQDTTFVYELPALGEVDVSEVVPVQVAHLAVDDRYRTKHLVAVGFPRVVLMPKSADAGITNEAVRAQLVAIAEQARVPADEAAEGAEKGGDVNGYTLCHMDKQAAHCGKCSPISMCDGCEVPDDSKDFNVRIDEFYSSYLSRNANTKQSPTAKFSFGVQWGNKGAGFDARAAAAVVKEELLDDSLNQPKKKKGLHLVDCLSSFVEKEVLCPGEEVYCSECKEFRLCTKKLDVWSTADLLIIHLKRFQHSESARDKIATVVEFPLEGLDLSQFVLDQDAADGALYDLYAVSNHMGGLGGGHYTAYAKNLVDKQWYLYDDSRVSAVDPSVVCSSSAYVLFYHRRSVAKEE